MPRRGYRKGISDTKVPLSRRIHTRLPETIHAALLADAQARSTTATNILRTITTAHYTRDRAELPHARGPNREAIYQLDRLGNNLNQLVHQGHIMRLHIVEADARRVLAKLERVLDTLL